MSGFDELFADEAPTRSAKPRAKKDAPSLKVVQPESEATEAPTAPRATSADRDPDVIAAADRYVALLPEIRAARPQAPIHDDQPATLTGEDWVIDAWKRALFSGEAGAFGLDGRFTAAVYPRADTIYVEVTVPPELAGLGRGPVADAMLAEAHRRQNLGEYNAEPGADKQKLFLIRKGAIDTSHGWNSYPKTRAFYRSATTGGTYHQELFDLVGLRVIDPKTREIKYPQREFGSDDRGGTVTLALPPGMLPRDVIAAEPALRAALAMPELTVTAGDGLRPTIHLNSKPLVRAFPKSNPLSAGRLWLPRTEAERYAVSNEIRLFLGVTETGEVVAPRLKDRSHAAIFGMTNSGKSTTMVILARSLAAQGAEVWLADAKGTPEFRSLYKESVAGITHLSVATPALMHATVHKLRELYKFRAAVANELADRGLGVDDILWPRVVLIFDEMGEFLNTALSDGGDKVAKAQAQATVNMLGEIGAKARAYGVHLIVAGQHVYVAALPNKVKEHLSIRAVLGKASDTHIQRLFDEQDRDAAKAAREGILPGQKGRGIVMADDAEVVQFQSFYNDADQAAKFARDTAGTPRLKRWGHQFPTGDDVPGAHGAWQSWGAWEGDKSFEPDGTVEDIGTVVLDRPNPVTGELEPDPDAAPWDMTSPAYNPGSPPRSAAFQNVN
ncbi:DUF87 domain-containing protein [Mycobacterium avium]|uniref:helicase HerA domain-containing protein n=1 Tax=Mycobacterium avium TaxID=1764 RepID=UPI000B23349C|nr:DUF87 domain-containing protein [Mycobacterium avium]WOF19458.1 DUF87 domain-containing protein [Mycobacterium avium]